MQSKVMGLLGLITFPIYGIGLLYFGFTIFRGVEVFDVSLSLAQEQSEHVSYLARERMRIYVQDEYIGWNANNARANHPTQVQPNLTTQERIKQFLIEQVKTVSYEKLNMSCFS